jgi:hypothetical protein
MRPLDIALVLFVWGGEERGGFGYFGSVTENTKLEYDNIRWVDEREKPTWEELNSYWESNQNLFDKFYN